MDVAPNTISLLLVNNNVIDETGNYVWTNVGAVPFDAAIKYEGSHSAGRWIANGKAIRQLAIAERVLTYEFYSYWVNGWVVGDCWHVHSGVGGAEIAVRASGIGADGYEMMVNGVWTPQWVPPDKNNVWYQHGVAIDVAAVTTTYFVDNVQRGQSLVAPNITGQNTTFGSHKALVGMCNAWIDVLRISDVTRTSFPTVDPVPVTTALTPKKFW